MRFGFKISGCFGDVLYSTPVLKYLSKCHGDKLDIETNFPEIFKNNPYVGVIYNPKKGEILPHDQIFYDCNVYNFGDIQKQIRKIHMTDYWSTNLGFVLSPEEKTLEFYPDPLNIEIPEGDYIVINPSKTWECRSWSKENWEKLTEMILGLGIKVIVTGQDITYGDNDKKESIEISNPNVVNLVNKLNLSQLWYLVNNSLLTITMNAGLLPFAGTTDANILELGGAIDPYYRTPYRNGSQNYKHKFVGGSCKIFCQSDMKYNSDGSFKITDGFPIHGCYENKPTFECHPSPNGVFNAILELFKKIKYKQKNITHNVIEIKSQTNKLMEITKKFDKSFILYGDKNYLPIIKKTIQSIRSFSDLPIFVYLLNHHEEIDEKNVFVKKWICNIRNKNEDLFNFEDNGNFYIDRNRVAIYDILIQRPAITKDVLEKFSNVICYLDADTTCLSNLEKIFDLYPDDEVVPYFTKGVYDFMYLDGVGDAGYDLTKTLEHPTCELYNIDQSFRFQSGYRQTGYYLAGQNTIPFINEWTEMCINPIIKDNTVKYAAYHEETIVNCLLWKHKVSRGLPSVYVNGSLETIDLINDNTTFTGEPRHIKDWLLVPSKREELFFIHGEKRLNIIDNMIEKLKGVYYKYKKIADAGYVINLPHRTDRKESVIKLLNELEITGYEFIDGVVLGNPEYKKMGCTAAYVNLFSKFLSSDSHNVIVFEDDIKLMNGVSKNEIDAIFDNWDETVSNYDVVGLGVKLLPRTEIKLKGKTHGSFEEMLCTQSLFYKRHFVDHLMTIMTEFLTPSSPFHKCVVDVFLNDCSSETYRIIHNDRHKKFDFGITVPMLFTQGPGFSDLEGRDQDYEGDMERAYWESLNKNKPNDKIKLLFVTPHLSTGGMPQFLLKRIKELQKYEDEIEIFLVEFCLFSDTYIIQRNKILQYLDENHFFNLSIMGEEKEKEKKETLINIIKENNIDIIHFEEITEGFEDFNILSISLLNQIYSSDRTWKIVESCHNLWFNPTNRNFKPEAYSLVTPFHLKETFKNEPSYKELHIYPIEDLVTEIKEKHQIYNDEFTVPLIEKISKRDQLGLDPFKTHVLNVGLWTSGKNQGEGFEIARNIWEKNKDIHFHFLGNQAPNFEDYWSPIMQNQPPNVTVWYERNDVSDFMIACDVFMFNSKWECNPLVIREATSYGMKILSRNLPQYMGMFDGYITEINDNDENLIESTSDKLLSLISSNKTYKLKEEFDFGKSLRDFYKKVLTLDYMKNKEIKNNYNVFNHYILNPYLEINGSTENELNVRFFDNDQLVYNNNININSWVKMNKQYYTNWRVEVREKDTLIYTNTNDYKGKRVFISFGSKSLGDTLAWFPYVEEFRKKHECELIVSTFLNDLFKDQYPNVEFVEPSDVVHNVVAQYNLGWYYTQKEGTESVFDNNIHKVDFKQIPLQQTSSDILGLDYKEIRPKLNLPKIEKKKKVGIGIHSTAQSKYWNNPNGWQEVVNYLRELGYEVMIYSREKDGYMGNKHPKGTTKFKGGSLQEVIDDMSECEFFIGLGSGLSWLAWACKLPVVLISGFSEKWAETTLDTYRVINESVCHGCFNKENFDAGDWNWCPLHKNTDRMFECTKEISSDMVIKQIEKIINKETPEVVVVEEKIDKDFDWGWMDSDDSLSEFHKSAITEEIFNNNIYEKLFEVEKGDVVLDVGASIGPFTYSILHKKPKHVFCVEPSESEFTTLIKNTIGNPVTHINKGLSDTNGIVESDRLFGGESHMESMTFDKLVKLYGLNKIDFLKTDCEGGEYEIFKQENIPFIKENIKKIAGEWHLRSQKDKDRFRYFRDNILPQFENYEVYSIDGVDIKWDLWNDHFIEYYNEVIIYIDNRK